MALIRYRTPFLVALVAICSCRGLSTITRTAQNDDLAAGILHLHATWTEQWCGGAEPDPSEWPRTTPWSGSLFIRRAVPDSTARFALNDLREPILDSINLDGAGRGWLQLPAGNYLVLDRDHVNRMKHDALLRDHAEPSMYTTPIDTACLRRWLRGPFPVHAITAGDTLHMEVPLHGQCSWYATPCVQHNGPLPP